MTTFGIVFWSALASLIIVISYFLRHKQKSEEREEQKLIKQRVSEKKDIANQLSEHTSRYRKVQLGLLIFGEEGICNNTESILREMYNKYYAEKSAYEVFEKCPLFIKEITVLESLLNDYQNKKIAKKQKIDEFNDLKLNLQSKINICENLELSEKQRNILSSVKNRLTVDIEKGYENPNEALKRTKKSLEKISLITSSSGGGFFYGDSFLFLY